MVRTREVDVDFADVRAGEIGIAERCVVGAGLLDRLLLLGRELRIGWRVWLAQIAVCLLWS